MDLLIQDTCSQIDWIAVRDAMIAVGFANRNPRDIQKAFQHSHGVVFVFHDGKLVGFGRVISDGVYQAALYDVIVLPEYQNQHIGSILVTLLLKKVAHCNVILYATPGKEGFYAKQGFRKMKTGMAHFLNPERMESRGLIESAEIMPT
jgi:predicted N-acetyltransferase YhbS